MNGQPDGAAASPDHGARGVLATRLDKLFTEKKRPDGQEYSYREVSEAINAAAGEKAISGNYIWQLRKGTRREPSARRLKLLADFFRVEINYFTGPEPVPGARDEDMRFVTALRDAGVRDIALRAHGLSDASKATILQMIEMARKAEGLSSPPEA